MNAHLIAQLRRLAATGEAEVCGALLGDGSTITEILPLPNRSPQPDNSFLIPAADVLSTERHAELRGLALIGFFHSHPRGAAAPSESDLIQAVPGYIYVIVTRDGEIRSWRLRGDRVAFDEVF